VNTKLKTSFALTISLVAFAVALVLSMILISLSLSDNEAQADRSLSLLESSYQEQVESGLRDASQHLADSLANPLYFDDHQAITNYLNIFSSGDRYTEAVLLDADGRLLNDGTSLFSRLGEQSSLNTAQLERLNQGETVFVSGETEINAYHPVTVGQETIGIVCLSSDTAQIYSAFEAAEADILEDSGNRRRINLGIAISTLFFLMIASYYIAGRVSSALLDPIHKLREQAIALGRGGEQNLIKIEREDEIGDLAKAVYSLASDLEMQNQSVKFLAFHDPLTGLLNRTGFQTRMEESLESLNRDQLSGALLFIDVDDFKEVNDSLGHDTGDRAIRAISDRLRKTISSLSSPANLRHLARIGGDEFAIFIAPLQSSAEISVLAEDLLSALSSPVIVEKERIHTSASIGIANYPEDGESPSTLLNNADAAMYTSKNLGKGTYRFYEPEMNKSLFRSSTIKVEFQKALRSEDELELLFQPIIDLSTGLLAAAEALIRWNHPRLGYLSPEQFIAIVEHNEVALPTDLWVLSKSLDLIEDLCVADMQEISISVNISASNLVRKQFPAAVRKLTKNRESLVGRIKLEITETFLHSDDDQVLGTMKKLQSMGFQIWLDDFGTGYSSLRHLKDFPIDGIKIDQTFISSLMDSDNDRNMVSALMALAEAFSAEVVAEGIDRQDSLETLRKWGVKYGQGMVIGEPVSPLRLVQLLGEERLQPNNLVGIQSTH
jgi:diguanylate cyclase